MQFRHLYLLIGLFYSIAMHAALTPITVALDWYINPDQAPILAAQAEGYFQQQGLAVTLISPTEETEPLKLVATERATFGITNQLSLLSAINAGIPIQRVAGLANRPMSCIAAIDPAIHSLKDLAGKTIGYSAGGSLSPRIIRAMLQHAGVDPNSVKLINVRMDLLQALISHRIDAAADVAQSVEVVQLQAMGYHPTVFVATNYGVPSYEEMVMITHTHTNPTTIHAFVTALTEGAQAVKAHPEQLWQTVSQHYPAALIPTPKMATINHAIWLATAPYLAEHPGTLNVLNYQHFTAFAVELGLIAQTVPVERYSYLAPA